MREKNINFRYALDSWGSELFSKKIIAEIMALKAGVLPLQHGLTQGDMAAEKADKIALLACDENETNISVKIAVFFTEIISGCSCGDDPATLNGYCEMVLSIDKQTGLGCFEVTN